VTTDTDIEHLEPASDRELLVAIVSCALSDPTFNAEDVVEIVVEQGREDIRQDALELIAVDEILDDVPEDDPEPDSDPEPEDVQS